jgi:hypothetical protein
MHELTYSSNPNKPTCVYPTHEKTGVYKESLYNVNKQEAGSECFPYRTDVCEKSICSTEGLSYIDYVYQSYTGTSDELITNDPTLVAGLKRDFLDQEL